MGVKDRLLEFIKHERLTVSEFERKCNLSNGYVTKDRSKLSEDKIPYIKRQFPRLNIDWVNYGEGEMLIDDNVNSIIMIPVINIDARGGFNTNDELGNEYTKSLMPFTREIAKDGDIIIPIYGDSMAPKFPGGCMVLIRKVELWREYLEFGATYVIELIDQRRIIKNIQKADDKDSFILESLNPKYQPTEIKKDLVNLVFRVIMSIQRESL